MPTEIRRIQPTLGITTLSDRILVMSAGPIEQVDPPASVFVGGWRNPLSQSFGLARRVCFFNLCPKD